jgi:hypothetical protein
MKTLDLNTYGVYEMNDVEMRNTDGGWGFLTAIFVAAVVYLITTTPRPNPGY